MDKMNCKGCGTENDMGAATCTSCGASMTAEEASTTDGESGQSDSGMGESHQGGGDMGGMGDQDKADGMDKVDEKTDDM